MEMQRRDRPGQQDAEEGLEAIRRQGGPFVAAVEATRMPMVVTDPTIRDNPIIYANDAFLDLCGYDLEEVLGQSYMFLAGDNTDTETAGRIREAMAARRTLLEDIQLYRKDGTPIWVSGFISPVIEDNRVIQHFASFIDITYRVDLERRLKQGRDNLERLVDRRTRKLEAAKARLEEEVERRLRMEAVLRDTLAERDNDLRYRIFLSREVDHRAKNALQLASSLLQIQARRTEDESIRSALHSAHERLMRMSEIHAILYQKDDPGSVDFGDYLRRLVHSLGETLQPSPGQVTIELEVEDFTCGADLATPLALTVSEAVTNALKHAFPEGRRGHIRVSLETVGGGLMRLTVRDDGVGSTGGPRPGSLGLDLIRNFAAQVRGKAAVAAADGAGTCVTVTFPDPQGGPD